MRPDIYQNLNENVRKLLITQKNIRNNKKIIIDGGIGEKIMQYESTKSN